MENPHTDWWKHADMAEFVGVVGHWWDTIDAILSDILVVTTYSQRNFLKF